MNSPKYMGAITKTIENLYGVNFDEPQITNPFENYLIAP